MKKEETPKKSFFSNWIVKNLLLTIFIIAVIIGGSALFLDIYTRHNEKLVVPDLTGLSVEEAEMMAAASLMRVEVTDSVYVDGMARGAVYRQVPAEGSEVKRNRRISLTINANQPKTVAMPNLVGYSMRQAKAELSSRGLRLGRLMYRTDMATNNVLDQLYMGRSVKPGERIRSNEKIDLIVGLNPSESTTYIPNLMEYKAEYAISIIQEHSLNIGKVVYDNTVRNAKDSLRAFVYRQVPEPSEYSVNMGAEISIYLTTDKTKLPAVDTLATQNTNL